MFLPLSDSPNYSERRPWVNYGLVAANVLVYIWASTSAASPGGFDAIVREWGFVPIAGRFESYFTSMFMHAGFMHLAGNMLFLWIFGDNVEARLGHLGYLCAYLASGLAAVLLFQALAADSSIPLVGASGAIFGVTGFYFIAFPNNRVRVLVFMFLIFFYEVRARWVLGAYFVIDFANLWLDQRAGGDGSGVAYAAHVGGFAFGVALALACRRFLPALVAAERQGWRGRRHIAPPQPRPAAAVSPERLIDQGLTHARARRISLACEAFEEVLRIAPATESGGIAALQLGIIRGRVLGDFDGARSLLRHAERHLVQETHLRRARAELSEIM